MNLQYVSGEELLKQGFYPCNDGDLIAKTRKEYDSLRIILMDENGKPHYFFRHGNDYFSYIEEVKEQEGV